MGLQCLHSTAQLGGVLSAGIAFISHLLGLMLVTGTFFLDQRQTLGHLRQFDGLGLVVGLDFGKAGFQPFGGRLGFVQLGF